MVQVHSSILDHPHPGLDPHVWDQDGKLLPEHKELIEKVLLGYINNEGLKDHDKWIKKVKIIGGITTYQYTFDSDIDIHMETDLEQFIKSNHPDWTPEQAHKYLNEFRGRINQHTPKLPDTEHPIEYYFETPFVNKEGSPRSGIYNVYTNEWEEPPITVDMEFSIEELAKAVVDAANEVAKELDISFGTIRRDVRRIEDLRNAADAWDGKQKEIYENKIQERLTNIEAEIANSLIERDKIVQDRRNYDPMGDAEIKFKYLQRFGYINLITELKKYVEDDGRVTEDEVPDIRQDLLELGLKEASLDKTSIYIQNAFWLAPDGTPFTVRDDSGDSKQSHRDWIYRNVETLQNYGIDASKAESDQSYYKEVIDQMFDSGWVRIGDTEQRDHLFAITVGDLHNIPPSVDNFIAEHFRQGGIIEVSDVDGGDYLEINDPFPNIQDAVNKALSDNRWTKSSKKADFLPSITHAPKKRWGPTDVEIPVDPDAAREDQEWFHGEHADKPRNRKWWKRISDWFTNDEPEDLDKEAGSVINIPNAVGLDARVYKNPSRQVMKNLFDKADKVDGLRYVSLPDGAFYSWVDKNLLHEQVIKGLGYEENWEAVYNDGAGIIVDERDLDAFNNAYFTASQTVKADENVASDTDQILQLTQQHGGATWNFSQGNLVGTDSFSVSTHLDRTQKIPADQLTSEVIEAYVAANQDLLSDSNNSLGTWNDGGTIYLDVVTTVADRDQAIELGRQHNQKAIFDLKNLEEIPTGGTGEVQSKKAGVSEKYWIDPNGMFIEIEDDTHLGWIVRIFDKLIEDYGLQEPANYDSTDEAADLMFDQMLEKGWIRVHPASGKHQIIMTVYNIQSIPDTADQVIDKFYRQGEGTVYIGDLSQNDVAVEDPFPNLQSAVNKELRNYVPFLNAGLSNLDTKAYFNPGEDMERYWVDPNGKVFALGDSSTHAMWIADNIDLLNNSYGMNITPFKHDDEEPTAEEYDYYMDIIHELVSNSWTRAGDIMSSSSLGLQVDNLRSLPSGAVDFILNTTMRELTIEDWNESVTLNRDQFPDAQKEINRQLTHQRAANKEARPRPKHRTDWTDQRYDLEPFNPLPTTFQKDINDKNLNWRHPWKYMGRPKGKGHTDQGDMTEILLQQEQPLSERESKKLPMDQDELVEEHKRLVKVLKSPSHKDDVDEAKKQEKELEEYKEASTDTGLWIAPDGETFNLDDEQEHSDWATSSGATTEELVNEGWIRFRFWEDKALIQVADILNIPNEDVLNNILLGSSVSRINMDDKLGRYVSFDYSDFVDNKGRLSKTIRRNRKQYAKKGSTYTDKEMETYYKEQHDFKDSDGGGNVYHDWNSNTNDFPKPEDLERPKVRLDRWHKTDTPIPSYEVTYVFSLPKDEYHGDYPDDEYQKSHGI